MKEFSCVIQDELGLHARPAGQLVKQVKAMDAQVSLQAKGSSVDMRKLFAIMQLGVQKGDEVTVSVTGPNEAADAQVLEQFFRANF